MSDEPYVDRHIGGKRKVGDPDRAILQLARRQHGVVARRQLLGLGLGPDAIDFRLRRGRLQPLYRAVYAAGHDSLTREGRWMAALLVSGRDAVLTFRAAARHWGVASVSGLDVTVPKQRRPAPGIELHVTLLPPDEIALRKRHPRDHDLAHAARHGDHPAPAPARNALHRAEAQRLLDSLSLHDLLTRYPGRPGTPAVRALLAARDKGATLTRSELEVRFLEFVDERGLPSPQTNQWIEGLEVDCLWPGQRLAVELDSRAFHDSREAFERDRERDRILQAAGWRPIRITSRQLDRSRDALDRDLRRLLGLPAFTLAA